MSETSETLHAAADALSQGRAEHFWSHVVGAGRANEGLRLDWQQHLQKARTQCGFRYVRFHGLYHDDMHVYSEADGKVTYNFQYCDTLFDSILDKGVRPFVELGFCPKDLASDPEASVFWWKGRISPPKSLPLWANLVQASVKHWIQRYGLAEVKTWYFECWNEVRRLFNDGAPLTIRKPNLPPFWSGTRTQYFEFYEATAKAIKGVDETLRVGGPATSNFVPDGRFDGEREDTEAQRDLADVVDIDNLDWRPVWLEAFLKWCNEKKLPVDFVSLHPYPTDWALDSNNNLSRRVRGLEATPRDLKLTRELVAQSAYPKAEIHLTEWNSSPSSRDHAHDSVPAAIYIVRTMVASLGLVDSIAYWTFTDVFEEEGAGSTPFHGGFGLISLQGLPKPTFHAFRLLSWLGDEILFRDNNHGIVTRHSTSGQLAALLYHYPPEMTTSPPPSYEDRGPAEATLKVGSAVKKSISLTQLPPLAPFRLQTLSPGHRGDVGSAWERLGMPTTLNRDVYRHLDEYSNSLNLRVLTADENGHLEFEELLEPWTLIAIQQIMP